MDDPNYIYAMMHGEIPNKKNPQKKANVEEKSQFDIDLDKKIDSYVDEMELEEDPGHQLQNPKAKRESIRLEIKEAIKLPDLSKSLDSAVGLIFSEGPTYLSPEANQTLVNDFNNASTILANIKLEDAENVDLQELTKISDDSMKSIVEMAIAKFVEERFNDSLSLFSLLTILNPAYSEYWFRFGLAAQKSDQLELASRAYAAALELDPNLLGARVFAAECFANRGLKDEASAEISQAKEFARNNTVEPMWNDLIASIEVSINGMK